MTLFYSFTLDLTLEELKKLREETTRSSQQKDSLIVQLQQTLVMLCQQQVQKFVQTAAPQTLQQNILPQPPPTLEQTLANLTNGMQQQ